MKDKVLKEFLTHSEETGRQVVESLRTGKKYYVEAIGNGRSNWGDLDPATGKITGNYGGKYTGSITKEQSIITEENGFRNIVSIDSGSPYGVILEMDSKYPNKETL